MEFGSNSKLTWVPFWIRSVWNWRSPHQQNRSFRPFLMRIFQKVVFNLKEGTIWQQLLYNFFSDFCCKFHKYLIVWDHMSRIISSKLSQAKSMSSLVMHKGGRTRNTLPNGPPLLTRSPRSLVLSISSAAYWVAGSLVTLSLTSSNEIINPWPLTSPMILDFLAIFQSLSLKYSPMTSAFSESFSSLRMFRTSIPTAHWIGPPPNVLK